MMSKLWTRWLPLEKPQAKDLFRRARLGVELLEDRAVPASLAGQVYIDSNLDGFKQASEAGLSGVEIKLTGTDSNGDAVDRTATTDSGGNYSFTGLLAGTYTLTETQPSGFLTATDTVGTAGGTVGANTFSDIVLAIDQSANGYLFGERGIRVAGKVFLDANANGVLDGGEAGRPGVLLTLTNTGTGATVQALSDANGDYSFLGLAPATYTVVATNADTSLGFTTEATLNLTITSAGSPNGEIVNQNFGLSAVGEIRGYVYHDVNNNGFFDAGDIGINNVEIRLTGTQSNSANLNRTINTSPDGSFRFSGVLAGTYSLTETQPANYDDGTITVGSAGGTAGPNAIVGIVLAPGVNATGYNFGERQTILSSLSGKVFIDVNGDGQKQTNEPGLANVLFQLSGVDDKGDPVNRTATSDGNGNFTFTGLRPGAYTLTETQPQNFGTGITSAGTAGGTVNGDVISNIVIVSGTTATNYRFGEVGNRASGQVFNDANGNGVRDGGESGRGGVLLTLTNATTGQTFNATTDAAGNFLFLNLGPGSYTLTAANPDSQNLGFSTDATRSFSIASDGVLGGEVLDQDFGLTAKGEIAGLVYSDRNGNGFFDAGDVGIGGVTIRLVGTQANGASVDRTLTTQANGSFRFVDVLAGAYSLTETQPANFDEGTITVGSAGGVAGTNAVTNIVLGAGVFTGGYHFGEREVLLGSLAGRVFIDINGDGIRQSNEPGIGNVVLSLVGVADNGTQVNLSATTNSDGTFTFSNVRAGTYTLTESQPANFANGVTRAGTAGGTVNGNTISNIVLAPNFDAVDYFFGEVGNRASGRVFDDLNGNGVLDGGEAGRAGVLLTLTNTTNGSTFTLISDANGYFQFQNLGPGSYSLNAANPDAAHLGFATTNPLTFSIPNDGVPGGEMLNQNVGLTEIGEVSGHVYIDRNGNGVFDAGDVGIGGVQIRLQGTQANGTAVNRTVNTEANGSFRFTGVLAGTYSLSEAQPNNFDQGTITVGSAGGTAGADSVANIVLGAGVTAAGYNFGELEVRFATLTGRVFIDRNRDGLFQGGEPGLSGVVVTLSGVANNGDTVSLTATTAADGTFTFNNVRPGTYTLTEDQPANFANGSTRAGTAGGVVNGNSIGNIVLGADTQARDYLFAEFGNRIAGTVFADTNANGVFDASEAGRAGVTVNLTGGGLNLSVVTDANGDYQFTDLGPGTFTITAAAPSGQTVTTGSISVTIPASGLVGQEAIDRDIGLVQASSLIGFIFLDLNNDGVQQANEAGFSSLQITLNGVQANGAAVTRNVASGENGRFVFENLLAGVYTVTPTLPAGVFISQFAIGTAGGTAGTSNISGITLGVGQAASGYRFGLRANAGRGVLAGAVFLDRNKNRRRDPGDLRSQDLTAGIEGVTIRLFGRDGSGNLVNLVTTTDFNGNYFFTDLAPGRYQINEIQPAFFSEGKVFVGSLGGRARSNRVDTIDLAAGLIGSGYDFSEILPSVGRRSFLASRYLS